MSEHEEDERKDFGHYLGSVVDNKDLRGLGWVRVTVPGLIEPASAWAFPTGGPQSSGAKNLGGYDVPQIGASVMVAFVGGDHDVPFFYGAGHGVGEQLSAGPDAPANANLIKVYETDRFLIVLNGISGSEQLLIKDKVSGALISMTPINGIEIGGTGIGNAPLVNGVVLASGIDTLTGATYGALGSASSKVTAVKE